MDTGRLVVKWLTGRGWALDKGKGRKRKIRLMEEQGIQIESVAERNSIIYHQIYFSLSCIYTEFEYFGHIATIFTNISAVLSPYSRVFRPYYHHIHEYFNHITTIFMSISAILKIFNFMRREVFSAKSVIRYV